MLRLFFRRRLNQGRVLNHFYIAGLKLSGVDTCWAYKVDKNISMLGMGDPQGRRQSLLLAALYAPQGRRFPEDIGALFADTAHDQCVSQVHRLGRVQASKA